MCVVEASFQDTIPTVCLVPRVRGGWFRVFNRNAKVYVLNGGLPRWLAEKRPLESGNGYDTKQKGSFYVKPDYSLVCTFDEVMDLINAYKKGECSMTVIDTRPKGRFDGVVPEPRPGPDLRSHAGKRQHSIFECCGSRKELPVPIEGGASPALRVARCRHSTQGAHCVLVGVVRWGHV